MVGFNDILDIGKEEEVEMLLQELLQEKNKKGCYYKEHMTNITTEVVKKELESIIKKTKKKLRKKKD